MNEYSEEFAPELDEAYAEDAFDEAALAAGDGAAGEAAVLGEGAVELAGDEAFRSPTDTVHYEPIASQLRPLHRLPPIPPVTREIVS